MYVRLSIVIVLFVSVVLFLAYSSRTVPYHSDEISWYFHTNFFEQLFLKQNTDQQFWSSYESLDHPQVSKYFFGAYLFVRDQSIFSSRQYLEETYGRWDFYFNEELADIGTSEFEVYIRFMRELNVLFTFGTLVCIFFIVRKIGNSNLLGLGVVFLSLINTLFITTMLRATSDAHMVFFVFLALLFVIQKQYTKRIIFPLIVGIITGLAISSKLTGLLLLYPLLFYEIGMMKATNKLLLLKRIVLLLLGVVLVWGISNPYLYQSPISGSLQYIKFREEQSRSLQQFFPQVALLTMDKRITATFCELVFPSCSRFRGVLTPYHVINIGLFVLGIISIIHRVRKKQNGSVIISLFFLLTLFTNTLVLPLYSDRYFLLPFIITIMISAFGAQLVIRVGRQYVISHRFLTHE